MAKFRKPKRNRTTYVYRDAYGKAVYVLRPGVDGVTEAFIADAHEFEDEEVRQGKRDSYHGLVHYDDPGEDGARDHLNTIADSSDEPQDVYDEREETRRRAKRQKGRWDLMNDRLRRIAALKLQGHSNVYIAKMVGISETRIRKYLSDIQEILNNYQP